MEEGSQEIRGMVEKERKGRSAGGEVFYSARGRSCIRHMR